MWKNVFKISKNKIIKVKGKQTINLKEYTNNINWNNTKCLFGNNNLSTKNGMFYFNNITNRKDDNTFELYTKGTKLRHIENEVKILEAKDYTKNISINDNIQNGILSFGINADYPRTGSYYIPYTNNNIDSVMGFSIYINDELFVRIKIDEVISQSFPDSMFPDLIYTEYFYYYTYTFNNLSIFEYTISRSPFIAKLKNNISNLNIKTVVDKKGTLVLISTEQDEIIGVSDQEEAGNSIIVNYSLDVDNGTEILDTNSVALFYEQQEG